MVDFEVIVAPVYASTLQLAVTVSSNENGRFTSVDRMFLPRHEVRRFARTVSFRPIPRSSGRQLPNYIVKKTRGST